MAIREILREDDPVLRKVCHKVENLTAGCGAS